MANKNQSTVWFNKLENGTIVCEIIDPKDFKGKLSASGKTYVLAYDSEQFGDVRVTVTVTRKNRNLEA
jgi:hypothetical protein